VVWGTYDVGKPRVRLLLEGLKRQGVEVITCHRDVWSGIEDKSQVKGVRRWLGLVTKTLKAYPSLVWRYWRLPSHDAVLLGYPGMVDLLVLWPWAKLRKATLAWDWFLSAYDTVVLDRKLLAPQHPMARLIWFAEWVACRLPDVVFMDTSANARRMEGLFSLKAGAVQSVWVGVDDAVFTPVARTPSLAGAPFKVLFYGQFIPLHGVNVIVEAARLLQKENIEFVVVGRGQEEARIDRMLKETPLPKLIRIPWLQSPQLVEHMAAADVVLGVFGPSEKARSVIPNKVFQILAVNRPLVTQESPAIAEVIPVPVFPAIQTVPANDPVALAAAIDRAYQYRQYKGDLPLPNIPVNRFDAREVGAQLVRVLFHSWAVKPGESR
jgi:glycosyltransferase involved in cell wall biosynthesis